MQDNKRIWLYKFWPRHFSTQVILLTTLLIFFTSTLTALFLVTGISHYQLRKSEEILSAIAKNISLGLDHYLIVKDYAEIEQLLLQAANFPSVRSIIALDATDRTISSVKRDPATSPEVLFKYTKIIPPEIDVPLFIWHYGSEDQGNPLAMGLDATELTLWQPIANGKLGWLKITQSVEDVQSDALHQIVTILLFMLLITTLAIWMIFRLLKTKLDALQRASEFALGLANINGQQIIKKSGSTEIEQLETSLNVTSTRLFNQELALLSANSLLKNVLDAASEVAIIATDTHGTITLFNSGAEKMLGYSSDEIIGKQTLAIFHLPAEVISRGAELSTVMKKEVSGFRTFVEIPELEGSEQREWTYITKTNKHFPVSLIATIIRAGDDSISGYLGIARDITELKRMDQMKSEFVSTVSHELRTPLTAIAGALGLIEGGALGVIPDTAKQMISIAHKNSLRLSFLINDLLDMEKLVAGKMRFDMKAQALLPLLEQSIEENQSYGIKRGVKLNFKHELSDIEVFVDSQRFMQVLSNLLSNAIKYSPDQGIVEISLQSLANKVRISVSDKGPGIPAEFRSRIFRKFSQADSSDTRQQGGTGLGLAITKELIERMAGKIDFESTEGQGSTFYFDMPLHGFKNSNQSHVATPERENNPRILIIEDEPDIAKLISIMLSREGYSLDIALNGQQALEALAKNRYAAVTLDLMLPDISGLELIHRIRNQPGTTSLPIIVVSAKMDEGKVSINQDFSAIEWLAKPIDEAGLLTAIRQYLPEDSKTILRVLHIEDDMDLHKVIRAMSGHRYSYNSATHLQEARKLLGNERFDLVILDLTLPDGSGWQILPEIRIQQPHARVIILSGEDISTEEAAKVEFVLLKSKLTAKELQNALNSKVF
jgi:PAS domain S-box-containing protein